MKKNSGFALLAFFCVACTNDKTSIKHNVKAIEQPKPLLYAELPLKDKALFDFYYLNSIDRFYLKVDTNTYLPVVSSQIEAISIFGDTSFGFICIDPRIPKTQALNILGGGATAIDYYSNSKIKQVWYGDVVLISGSDKILYNGHDKEFMDTLRKHKDVLCPWLKRFVE